MAPRSNLKQSPRGPSPSLSYPPYPPEIDFHSAYPGQRAVSINQIITTEKVTILPDLHPLWRALSIVIPSLNNKADEYRQTQGRFNYAFDAGANDEFTRGLATAQQTTFNTIKQTPAMQELLSKASWNMGDRIQWEETLGEIASRTMGDIFGRYRTEILNSGNVKRTGSLNELSSDIRNKEEKIEFDCEAMSIVKGMIMQKADQDLLSSQSSSSGNYKFPTSYYYVTEPGHAFIVSPTTMSVIEGENASYHKNVNPWVDFQQFIEGEPIVVLPPGDPHAQYQAFGQIEGAGRLVVENQILTSLQAAEFHSQQLDCHLVSPPDGELMHCGRDLRAALVLAEEEWLYLFRLVTGNELMESVAKESFERNFLNKFKRSTTPLQDSDGEITTLGEAVSKWANGMPTAKRSTTGAGHASHVPLRGSQRVHVQQHPVSITPEVLGRAALPTREYGVGSMAHRFDRIGSSGPRGQMQPGSGAWSAAGSVTGGVEEISSVTRSEAETRVPSTSNPIG